MYDPTVFDNLKVAIENRVYDLDNLDRKIRIVNRKDQMDFAVLARHFAIQFSLVQEPELMAEVVLEASLAELATEILETPGGNPGCVLKVRFLKTIEQVDRQCRAIEETIQAIWEEDVLLHQTLSFSYKDEATAYENQIELTFKTKITEEHMNALDDFLDHVLGTMQVLLDQ